MTPPPMLSGRRDPAIGWTPLLASALVNVLGLAIPIAVLQIYDRIIPHKAVATLALLMSAVVLASALDGVLRIARSHIAGWAGARFTYRSYVGALDAALKGPLSRIESVPTGEHMDRLSSIDPLREFHANQMPALKVDLPFAGLYLLLLALIGGWLALVPVCLIVVCGCLTLASSSTLHAALRARAEQDDRRYNFILDALNGLPTIKALGLEAAMQRRYERLMGDAATIGWRTMTASGLARSLSTLISETVTISMAIACAVAVIRGQMTIGQMAAGTMLAGRILPPVLRGLALWTQYQSIRIADRRYQALTDCAGQAPAAAFASVESLGFTGATLGHDSGRPLLTGANLTVRRGEIVALVGPNGCGKSSLLAALAGEDPPLAGALTVNGEACPADPLHGLHAHVALLPQRAVLFHGSVLENLAAFDIENNLEEALALAAELGLDRVFAAIPGGYEMTVGENIAQHLPIGIVQAIAIVRALVARPAFILFDEANSALDSAMDARLRRMLLARSDRTGLIISSYRPSLLSLTQRGYAIENGTLVELVDNGAVLAARRKAA